LVHMPRMSLPKKADSSKAVVLQERFVVSFDHVVGEGSFGKVCKGLDRQTNKEVAIKLFNTYPGEPEWEKTKLSFQDTIETMRKLASSRCTNQKAANARGRRISFNCDVITADSANQNGGTALPIMEHMNLSECFVKLIAFSGGSDGVPGLDIEADRLYIVFELGSESLEDCLSHHSQSGTTLSVDELRCVHWCLVSIVCGLHAAGYVHMDIKPGNIVRFGGVWKLIDFDGAVPAGTTLARDRLLATPCYMAPEAAKMLSEEASHMEVSRLMDVWSVGMCAMEAIFLQPVLMPWYIEWSNETGDTTKYMKWLADYTAAPAVMDADMCQAMNDIDPDMCSLLKCMLEKDPSRRSDIAECLVHSWFAPMRKQLWKRLDEKHSGGQTMSFTSSVGSVSSCCSRGARPSLFGRRALAQHSKACSMM